MPFEDTEVKRLLVQKFEFEETQGKKHDAYAFYYNGKKIATTRFSRGSRIVIGDSLLQMIAREIQVHRLGFVKGMFSCTNSRDDYIAELQRQGLIDP